LALTAETYRRVVSESPEGVWELHHGRLTEKPTMSFRHHDSTSVVAFRLMGQLDFSQFRVHINGARLERSAESYFVPDVAVIPVELIPDNIDDPRTLDFYDRPLLLVIEVCSPSTGDYDIDAKIPEYRARGDQEIWRLHAYDRAAIVWRRRPDGTYQEIHVTEGYLDPASLPGVSIALSDRFL
jgi:Uma2 family endonuclease